MNRQFGMLLSEGISSIAHRWCKTKSAIHREMTEQLREANYLLKESTIAGWCRGFVPKEPDLIEWIICYCMRRGRVDRSWVESMLHQARHPEREIVLSKLFPTPVSTTIPIAEHTATTRLPSYVDDPMVTLRSSLKYGLIGRDEILQTLKQQIVTREHMGMFALTGLPGVGKTTLAMELAHSDEIREAFDNGVLWANLGLHPDVIHHLERWAKLLGLPQNRADITDVRTYAEVIHTSIGQRRMLLVIEDAWKIEDALAFKIGGPQCAHLLTTRFSDIALHFAGQGVTKVKELNEYESIQLLERFVPQVVQSEPEHVRTLVRAVNGLPLALTLVGKHLQVHSFHMQPRRVQSALLALQQTTERLRLENPQGPLEGNAHTSLSLMASIDTSYHALSEQAQQALCALYVFPVKPNTFSEEAALAVSDVPPSILDELTDAGLLESISPGRYTLHQTIADYASLKQVDKRVQVSMVEFFVYYVSKHSKIDDMLDQESHNIMSALDIALSQHMLREFVNGVKAFFPFWLLRGWYEVASRYCQQELHAARQLADRESVCTALLHIGTISNEHGDFLQSEKYAQEGLSLARILGHPALISTLLHLLGKATSRKQDFTQTEVYAQEGLALARQIGDSELTCFHLHLLGTVATNRGQYEQADTFLQEGLQIARQIGHTKITNHLLTTLGTLASMCNEYQQADAYYQEGLDLARKSKNVEREAAFLQGLGVLAGIRYDYAQAEQYFQAAFLLAKTMGLHEHLVTLLTNLGRLRLYQGKGSEAEKSYQEALALAREQDDKGSVCDLLSSIGALYSKKGNLHVAVLYLEECLTLTAELQHHYYRCNALLEQGMIAIKLNDFQKAKICFQEGHTLANSTNNVKFKSGFLNGWGEIYLRQGQIDTAAISFKEALALARKIEEKEEIAQSLYGLGRVAFAHDHVAEAFAYGQECMQLFEFIDAYAAHEVRQWLYTTFPIEAC